MRFEGDRDWRCVIECMNGTRPVFTLDIRILEDGADGETAQHADRHAALRVLRLLGHGRYAVEANVGKEDDGRGLQDAAPTEFAEGAGIFRYVGYPVMNVDVLAPNAMTAMTMLTLIATMTVFTIADSLMPL